VLPAKRGTVPAAVPSEVPVAEAVPAILVGEEIEAPPDLDGVVGNHTSGQLEEGQCAGGRAVGPVDRHRDGSPAGRSVFSLHENEEDAPVAAPAARARPQRGHSGDAPR